MGQCSHERWVVASEGERLVGAFGFDVDLELGRAWLYGPFVRHGAWATTADSLWAALLPLLPGDLREHELFFNVKNVDGLAFAERHGFPLHGDALILRFGRDALASLPELEAQELQPSQHAAFEALHARTFPNTYPTRAGRSWALSTSSTRSSSWPKVMRRWATPMSRCCPSLARARSSLSA